MLRIGSSVTRAKQDGLVPKVAKPIPPLVECLSYDLAANLHARTPHEHGQSNLVATVGLVDHLVKVVLELVNFLLRQGCRAPHGIWSPCLRQEAAHAGKRSTEHGRDHHPRSLAAKVHLAGEALLVDRHARRTTEDWGHRRLGERMQPIQEFPNDQSQKRLCHVHENAKRHGLHLFLHGLDLNISLACNDNQTGDGTNFASKNVLHKSKQDGWKRSPPFPTFSKLSITGFWQLPVFKNKFRKAMHRPRTPTLRTGGRGGQKGAQYMPELLV